MSGSERITSTQVKRMNHIDFAKGVAILSVVVGHLFPFNGPVFQWIFGFHMPFFFLLQGYMQKDELPSFKIFIEKKAKRLLVPGWIYRFIYSILLGDIIISRKIPGIWEMLFRIFWHPAEEWFLPVSFLVGIGMYVYVILIKRYGKNIFWDMATPVFIAILTLCCFYYPYHDNIWIPFKLDSCALALSFALIGYWMKKWGLLDKLYEAFCSISGRKPRILFLTVIFILYTFMALMNAHFSRVNMASNAIGVSSLSYFVAACLMFAVIMTIGKRIEGINHIFVKWIRLLGKHSLLIYLGHSVGNRIITFVVEYLTDGRLMLRPNDNLDITWIMIFFAVTMFVLTILCLLLEKREKAGKVQEPGGNPRIRSSSP